MIVLALVPLARSTAVVASADRDRVPDRAVMRRVAGELGKLQDSAAGGWTDETVATAAVADAPRRSGRDRPADQPASRRVAGAVPKGRLLVQHGSITSDRATVSSSVTADDLARALAQSTALSTTRRQQIEGLQSSLTRAGHGVVPPAADPRCVDPR